MKSALGLILGVSFLATIVNCSSSGDDDGTPPVTVAGAPGAGSGSVVPGGNSSGGAGTDLPAGVPLDPMNGWVDGASNALMIQGAMFPFGDDTSKMGMTPMDFSMSGADACLKGTAAKVDLKCTPVAPATDCYGTFWGAAIGLNLNQQIDAVSMMGGSPMPFNASAIKGFAFEIAGASVPGGSSLRFKVEDATGEYCNPGTKPVKAGVNSFMFEDLIKECWAPKATAANGSAAKPAVLKIAWQVVTNAMGTVPFDFCVKNLRALQ